MPRDFDGDNGGAGSTVSRDERPAGDHGDASDASVNIAYLVSCCQK